MLRLLTLAALTTICAAAHATGVYHAKADATICSDRAPSECRTVDGSVLMERMQWYHDPWRVRIVEGGAFAYYLVHQADIEPAVDAQGEQLHTLCMPGGGGVYSRPELAADGTVKVKRFLITVTCRDGKAYSATRALN